MFSYPLSSPTMAQPQTQQRETHESCLSCHHFEVSDSEAYCTFDTWLLVRETTQTGEVNFLSCEHHSERTGA